MNRIPLVLATDANFAPYTYVTMASALHSKASHVTYDVYLLTPGDLSAQSTSMFSDLANRHEAQCTILTCHADAFSAIQTTSGISKATYFRLLMHRQLPPSISTAIYLDSDLLIRDCLSSLYTKFDRAALFAGVQDSRSLDYNRNFYMPLTNRHINAGVCVVNVERMRDDAYDSQLFDYLDFQRHAIVLGDQQIINCGFSDDIDYLPLRWNVHGSLFDDNWCKRNCGVANTLTIDEVREAVATPAIIHYTFKRKPWHSLDHPASQAWWKFVETLPHASSLGLSKPPSNKAAKHNPTTMQRAWGYVKSLRELRANRLLLNEVSNETGELKQRTLTGNGLTALLECNRTATNSILQSRRKEDFKPTDFIRSLPEFTRIYSNAALKDLDGGFHGHLRQILRTNLISDKHAPCETDWCLLLSQRLHMHSYWECLRRALQYESPLIYAEATFFGAFSPYFEPSSLRYSQSAFGYILDDLCYYFDSTSPSRLELYLQNTNCLLAEDLLSQVRSLISYIVSNRITKYNVFTNPRVYYKIPKNSVVVFDQKPGDASITAGGADQGAFQSMLKRAVNDNPSSPIYIKTHPDNFGSSDLHKQRNVHILPDNADICLVLDQCEKVYVVTSQVGFEALLRQKDVHVFGRPFYAGWGLTHDYFPIKRRSRLLSVEQLFYAACIRFTVYFNFLENTIVSMQEALDIIKRVREQRV